MVTAVASSEEFLAISPSSDAVSNRLILIQARLRERLELRQDQLQRLTQQLVSIQEKSEDAYLTSFTTRQDRP